MRYPKATYPLGQIECQNYPQWRCFVLVSDTVVCSEQPQLKSDCEITWVNLEIVGSQPLYIAAHYKPKEDDQSSLDMLRCSLERLIGKKGSILVQGELTAPNSHGLTAIHLLNLTVHVGQCMTALRTYSMTST